ncbi:MAG TPA: thioredoxin family protein [Pricia sp.]|nr:thioredoxin family protein [Pricia sp.]
MRKSVFYHVGCPECISAEHDIEKIIGPKNLEVVNLGKNRSRIPEAEKAGVKSVPVLVGPNGNVEHISYGVSIKDIKF